MTKTLTSTRGKVLASAAVVAAAASVAGLGTFGSFTSTTSASASVGSGTVRIELGPAAGANRYEIDVVGMVPGDTIQGAATLNNTGNQNLSAITLTTAATTSSLLDTDSNGLQLKVERCSTAWTEGGTAPAYTYTCPGTLSTVLAQRPVVGTNMALPGLSATTAGASDNLKVTMSLPAAAGNAFQNQSSVVSFSFTGTQRTSTDK